MERNYQDAIAALNTLQSNFAAVQAIQAAGPAALQQAIPEMVEWCRKAGYEVRDWSFARFTTLTDLKPTDFDSLNAIHIAGTKGKGSTSAFISSILSQYLLPSSSTSSSSSSRRLHKIGLYTSPHLRFVRERIKINNLPLSEDEFARHFFTIWDRLEESTRKEAGSSPTTTDSSTSKPMYFRYLTLMAFHAFLQGGVDTAVIETGLGGEHDSTNVIVHPTVVGITSLGIDHVAMLGGTIEEIAWHKAGIMKRGAPAYTVPQPEGAMEILQRRAAEKGVTLTVVQRHPEIDQIPLGLAADFQKINASLAVAIAASHLRRLGFDDIPADITTSPLPAPFRLGLQQVQWEGRCQMIHDPANKKITWYIDGAHTAESITLASQWYDASTSSSSSSSSPSPHHQQPKRILIFNQQTRNAPTLIRVLHETLHRDHQHRRRPFSHVLFCTNVTFTKDGYRPDLISLNANDRDVQDLTVQNELAKTWREIETEGNDEGHLVPTTDIRVLRTIQEAVEVVRELAAKSKKANDEEEAEEEEFKVLVTGSLHLVGGFLEVLDASSKDKEG